LTNVRGIHYNSIINKSWYENNEWKGSKMTATYKIGDVFTTLKSKVTGTIEEIVPNASGSVRVRLNVNGQPRWTTYKA
jgi:hypothetical protein